MNHRRRELTPDDLVRERESIGACAGIIAALAITITVVILIVSAVTALRR